MLGSISLSLSLLFFVFSPLFVFELRLFSSFSLGSPTLPRPSPFPALHLPAWRAARRLRLGQLLDLGHRSHAAPFAVRRTPLRRDPPTPSGYWDAENKCIDRRRRRQSRIQTSASPPPRQSPPQSRSSSSSSPLSACSALAWLVPTPSNPPPASWDRSRTAGGRGFLRADAIQGRQERACGGRGAEMGPKMNSITPYVITR